MASRLIDDVAAVPLVTVGEGAPFSSAAHLVSYAGLAPATKSSGTSIHSEHTPKPSATARATGPASSTPCSATEPSTDPRVPLATAA
jgi:hypothetical protein